MRVRSAIIFAIGPLWIANVAYAADAPRDSALPLLIQEFIRVVPTLTALITGVLSVFLGFYFFRGVGRRLEIFQGGKDVDKYDYSIRDLQETVNNTRSELKTLRSSLEKDTRAVLDEDLRRNLTELAMSYMEKESGEQFIKKASQEFGQKIFDSSQMSLQTNQMEKFIQGLYDQIRAQKVNANTNLYIGLVFATVGLLAMVVVFYETLSQGRQNLQIKEALDFFTYFVPRFGLVILVESVAFFFLNLYREDRALIKFLRNEITNVEFKMAALLGAVRFGKGDAVAKVLAEFSKAERNFVVKKGERVISDNVIEETNLMFERVIDKVTAVLGKLQPQK